MYKIIMIVGLLGYNFWAYAAVQKACGPEVLLYVGHRSAELIHENEKQIGHLAPQFFVKEATISDDEKCAFERLSSSERVYIKNLSLKLHKDLYEANVYKAHCKAIDGSVLTTRDFEPSIQVFTTKIYLKAQEILNAYKPSHVKRIWISSKGMVNADARKDDLIKLYMHQLGLRIEHQFSALDGFWKDKQSELKTCEIFKEHFRQLPMEHVGMYTIKERLQTGALVTVCTIALGGCSWLLWRKYKHRLLRKG